MYVYSYYNKKVGVYQDPFIQPTTKDLFPKLVTRSVVLNPKHAQEQHLYECDLYYLGTFDEETGSFDLLDKPEFLVTLSNLEVKDNAA